MKLLLTALVAGLVAVSAIWLGDADGRPEQGIDKSMHTYVFVHGASGGAWDWKGVDEILTDRGHEVYRVTLTGLGERAHLASDRVNLTTHILDVANTIAFESLNQVVLVGHSYGGMVITGVMNHMPDRIKQAVFLDAAVPAHGMSAFDLWPDMAEHRVEDGMVYFSWLNPDLVPPGDVPQPLATLTEPVAFNNVHAQNLPAVYIGFVDNESGAKTAAESDPSWQRAVSREWPIYRLISDHNAQRSHPYQLADLLESVVK
jgi:pimeloyl-ACP methyl ester carboxylesterase